MHWKLYWHVGFIWHCFKWCLCWKRKCYREIADCKSLWWILQTVSSDYVIKSNRHPFYTQQVSSPPECPFSLSIWADWIRDSELSPFVSLLGEVSEIPVLCCAYQNNNSFCFTRWYFYSSNIFAVFILFASPFKGIEKVWWEREIVFELWMWVTPFGEYYYNLFCRINLIRCNNASLQFRKKHLISKFVFPVTAFLVIDKHRSLFIVDIIVGIPNLNLITHKNEVSLSAFLIFKAVFTKKYLLHISLLFENVVQPSEDRKRATL